jgi:archaeal flagellar protein FlaJ
MFEDLKKNIEHEKKIISDMNSIMTGIQGSPENRDFYVKSLGSLTNQLRMLNRTVPELLKEWSPIKGMASEVTPSKGLPIQAKKNVVRMSYISPSSKEKRYVTIDKKDRKEFLSKLRVSESGLSNLQKKKKKEEAVVVSQPSYMAKISNQLFRKTSDKLAPQFYSLSQDLKKANIRFSTTTYLSIALFVSLAAFVFGLIVFGVLMIFSLSNWVYIAVPFVLFAFSLMGFYFYPSSEANSVQKKITQELPFATIHMAAIAGSNIEPTKIFGIISVSKEYPNIGKEMRKVINQVEIYGYDLVTALKNVAKRTSNKRLAELFGGLATNILTGGELKSYLEKKAENYLLDYKLDRRKYSDLAGTFMDVYISILIAAPLVLMMMFIVMNVAGLGFNMSIFMLLAITVGAVILINIVFLIVLNIKQPKV